MKNDKGESKAKHASPPPGESKSEKKKSKTKGDGAKKAAPPQQTDKKKAESSRKAKAGAKRGSEAVNVARDDGFGGLVEVGGLGDVITGVSKFADEHPELTPAALGSSWLDFVDKYIMPTVKRQGFFSDDTTVFTGKSGWETYNTMDDGEEDEESPKLSNTKTSGKGKNNTLTKLSKPSAMKKNPMFSQSKAAGKGKDATREKKKSVYAKSDEVSLSSRKSHRPRPAKIVGDNIHVESFPSQETFEL